MTLSSLTLVINLQNDSKNIYIVKCFYLCASAAVFDNNLIQAQNQLRNIKKKNSTIKHVFARLNKFEKKLVTTIPYSAEIIPKTGAVYISANL